MQSIDIKEQELAKRDLLDLFLKDMTTNKNILWATDDYSFLGSTYEKECEITAEQITGKNEGLIKPRVQKPLQDRIRRTRDKAEVFTPSWVCNMQNNLVDEAWFGRKNVFNTSEGKSWEANYERIVFPKGKTWQDYVLSNRLEITCGEAPYLTSRYDTVSGDTIPVEARIGLLDRKLRVVSENIFNEADWFSWAKDAFKSIYGYEFQGDNLILARENLLASFSDFFEYKFNKKPTKEQERDIAEIIVWNIWQMDGITCAVPYTTDIPCLESIKFSQDNFMSILNEEENEEVKPIYCKIMDWKEDKEIFFIDIKAK